MQITRQKSSAPSKNLQIWKKLAVAGEIGEIIKNANIVATYTKMSDVISKNQLRDFKQALDNLIGEIELVD